MCPGREVLTTRSLLLTPFKEINCKPRGPNVLNMHASEGGFRGTIIISLALGQTYDSMTI